MREVARQRSSFGVHASFPLSKQGLKEAERFKRELAKHKGRMVREWTQGKGFVIEALIPVRRNTLASLTDAFRSFNAPKKPKKPIGAIRLYPPGTGTVSNCGTGTGETPIRKRRVDERKLADCELLQSVFGDCFAIRCLPSIETMLVEMAGQQELALPRNWNSPTTAPYWLDRLQAWESVENRVYVSIQNGMMAGQNAEYWQACLERLEKYCKARNKAIDKRKSLKPIAIKPEAGKVSASQWESLADSLDHNSPLPTLPTLTGYFFGKGDGI
jgi:hypothetical protein